MVAYHESPPMKSELGQLIFEAGCTFGCAGTGDGIVAKLTVREHSSPLLAQLAVHPSLAGRGGSVKTNSYFLAKIRFDTAENEPAKKLQNLKF